MPSTFVTARLARRRLPWRRGSVALLILLIAPGVWAAPPSPPECTQWPREFDQARAEGLRKRASEIDALVAELARVGVEALRARLDRAAGAPTESAARAHFLLRIADRLRDAGIEGGAAPVYEMAARALDGHCPPATALPWLLWLNAADAWRAGGLPRVALEIYNRLLSIAGGPPARSRAAILALSGRGDAHRMLNAFQSALADQREALARANEVLGPTDPDRIWMHQRIALIYDEWPGHDAEAEAPYREVLRLREAQTPVNRAQRGRARLNLAGYLADNERFEEALELARSAEDDWRAVYGDSLARLDPLHIIIRASARLERFEDVFAAAERAAHLVVSVRQRVTPEALKHHLTAAHAALRLGRFADARRHMDTFAKGIPTLDDTAAGRRILDELEAEFRTRRRGFKPEELRLDRAGWHRERPGDWRRDGGGGFQAVLAVNPRIAETLTQIGGALRSSATHHEQRAGAFRGAPTTEWHLIGQGEGDVHHQVIALTKDDVMLLLSIQAPTAERLAAARAEVETGLVIPAFFGAAPADR